MGRIKVVTQDEIITVDSILGLPGFYRVTDEPPDLQEGVASAASTPVVPVAKVEESPKPKGTQDMHLF